MINHYMATVQLNQYQTIESIVLEIPDYPNNDGDGVYLAENERPPLRELLISSIYITRTRSITSAQV